MVRAGRRITAIGVKSGRSREAQPGLAAFGEVFRPARKLLVGGNGIAVESSLAESVEHWTRS